MPQVTVYVREEDIEKWRALPRKSEFIHYALQTVSVEGIEMHKEVFKKNKSVGKPTKPEGMSDSEWEEQTRMNVEANLKYDAIRKGLRGDSVIDMASLLETTPPRIKDKDTPFRTTEEWEEAEDLEKKCCKLQKPCQHWIYNGDTQIWQNTLSGRQRSVEN